ncbi:TPA: two-component sensor histidine kinase [Burkholderia vietnamiensis]|nr:two-component sensor histidine kinase [Burkholderia vietnamiensis]
MDGRQRRASRSLTWQLTWWIGGVISALSVLAGGVSFSAAYHEANKLQDSHLREIGALIDDGKLVIAAPAIAWPEQPEADVKIVITRMGHTTPGGVSTSLLDIPNTLPDGLQDLETNHENWRVNVHTMRNGERVAVSERSTIRDEIARDGALRTLFPMLALTPVLVFLVVVLVRSMLSPVRRLAEVVDKQNDATLDALSSEGIPSELIPFVTSINRLIGRLKSAMVHQRRFIADAAHELRSPLAALSMQAENLSAATSPLVMQERLASFQAAIRRIRRLVEQLLEHARSQHGASTGPSTVCLRQLATDAIGDAVALANWKNVDLGLRSVDDVDVVADAAALTVVLRNLVDNAVRYTPASGTVDVSITRSDNYLTLEVQDSGPGIPADQLARVLEPFYRVPGSTLAGSGLGLSIVSEIARRNDGELLLENTNGGLLARYRHPL